MKSSPTTSWWTERVREPAHLTAMPEVLGFTLGGLSKSIGLPQLKLAWIAVTGPAREVDDAAARLEVICDAYLSVSTPVQAAAADAAGRAAGRCASRFRSVSGRTTVD